jgi:hypothetical protein
MNNVCTEHTKSHSFTRMSPNLLDVYCSICELDKCIQDFAKNNGYTFVHPCTDLPPPMVVDKCNNYSVALAMKGNKNNHMMTQR